MELIERTDLNVVKYLSSIKYVDFRSDCITNAYDKGEKQPTEKDMKTWYSILQQFCKTNIKTKGITKRIYTYSQTTPAGLGGRLFSGGSLQSIWSVYRGALMRVIGTDIDMSNAHPTILRYICKIHNIHCSELEYYITNRDECLAQFANRSIGKNMFLIATNNDKLLRGDHPKCLKKYDKEMKTIQKELTKLPDYTNLAETIPEYKLTHNYNGSYVNRILCYYENIILQHALHIINTKGIEVAILMFDGLMIYGNYYEDTELLNEIETYVETQLEGLNMKWAYKPHDHSLCVPDDFVVKTESETEYEVNQNWANEENRKLIKKNMKDLFGDSIISHLPSGREITEDDTNLFKGVMTDLEATEKLYRLYPYWVFCMSELFVYDNTNGMWLNNHTAYLNIIKQHKHFLHLMVKDEKKSVWIMSETKSYGNCLCMMEKIVPLMKTMNMDDNWLKQHECSSLGYILFKNGYYDFKNGLFHDKFNPDILFMVRIDENFEALDDDEVDYMDSIKKRIFHDPLGVELGNYFLEMTSRAFSGECMKRILFGLGGTNGGKSIMTLAYQFSLGGYFGTFNGENLVYNKSSADEAQKLRWALLLRFKRIIMSNEMKNTDGDKAICMDGNMVKKISAGGDPMIGRTHCKEETSFIAQFLPILLANDMAEIKPHCDAVDGRMRIIKFNKSFVEEPTNELELQIDKNIKDEIKTPLFQKCFRMLLLKTYADWNDAGRIDYEPPIVMEGKIDWVRSDTTSGFLDGFMNDFEITGIETDYIKSSVIQEWLNKQKLGISMMKFSVELKKYLMINKIENVYSKDKKIGGKTSKCWFGIKEIIETYEIEGEENIE